MNAAVNAALIAAAAAKEEAANAVRAKFAEAKAFGPATAIVPDIESPEQQSAIDELQGLGIVRALGGGRYYLDRDRQAERKAQQGRIALIVLAGLVSLLASVVALLALT